jgi:hypothetical protein
MKSTVSFRRGYAVIAVCGMLLLTGCAGTMGVGHYEYRYRIFEAKQMMPSATEVPISTEMLAQRYQPAADIHRAMDDLTREGFRLSKIDRIQWSNYYTFTFRRPLPSGTPPQRAPMELSGAYRTQSPGNSSRYYACSPSYNGCTVVVLDGSETPEVIETTWDGHQLVGRSEDCHHSFCLSGDGLSITHIQEKMLAGGMDRQVFSAMRLQNGRP